MHCYIPCVDLHDWSNLNDEELFERNISQLNLKLYGSELEPLIDELYNELSQKGLTFSPPCFVGDEWFCPVGIPAIFIPFFLTHDRLRRLERKIILEVEGDTKQWFMRLMRHEAGHAYSFAYRLNRKKKWQQNFGLASTKETDTYRPRPYSRSYVLHLDDWYAQSHPDEDFAETFAVWLTPDLDWRERYRGWNALRKLEYVDELMQSIAGKQPVHQPKFRASEFNFLDVKLKDFYAQKRQIYEESYPDFYDKDLRRIFSGSPGESGCAKASRTLKSYRRQILSSVCLWTNEKKYTVNQLLAKLIKRCDELDLHVKSGDVAFPLHVTSYITTLVMNYLFTGKFKRSK